LNCFKNFKFLAVKHTIKFKFYVYIYTLFTLTKCRVALRHPTKKA